MFRCNCHSPFGYCNGLIYDDYRETARKEAVFCSCCNHFTFLIDGNHQPPNLTKTPQMRGAEQAHREAVVFSFPVCVQRQAFLSSLYSTYPHTLLCKTSKLEKSHIHAMQHTSWHTHAIPQKSERKQVKKRTRTQPQQLTPSMRKSFYFFFLILGTPR